MQAKHMTYEFRTKTLVVLLTVPAGIALAIGALAPFIVLLEHNFAKGELSPFVLQFSAQSARTALSVAAGGAITALSLTYSLVLLVFTLAASKIGPRLLRRFTSELVNQITAGIFGGTFLYSLGALFFVQDNFVPKITIFGAGILSILSVMQLVYFVRHVSQSVSVDDEIAKIAEKLISGLKSLRENDEDRSRELPAKLKFPHKIASHSTGYIGAADKQGLCEIGCEEETVLKLGKPADSYILDTEVLLFSSKKLDDKAAEKARANITVEAARTNDDSIAFLIHLLVEIALRALSPGVNDPYTAIAVVNALSNAFSAIIDHELGTPLHSDEVGEVRLIFPPLSVTELMGMAFHPLRQAANGNIIVYQAMATAFARLHAVSNKANKSAIEKHVKLLMKSMNNSGHLDADIDSVLELLPAKLRA